MPTRRALVALLALALGPVPALAQPAYPSGPVKLVVGFAPGGGNDVLARILAERFRERMGQPFVVENRPGASGVLAIDAVKRAPPDGLTLLVGPSSGMTVNPVTLKSVTYDPLKDFTPIGVVGFFPLLVAVHPSLPISSIAELIAYAKARPGQLNYASAASSFQLATEMFAQMADLSMVHVPYRGSAPAVTAVLANQVPLTFGELSAVLPHVRAGALKALAISTAARSPNLPEVPTVAESGLPGYDMVLWSGLFAPAGTPAEIVDRLHREMREALQDPKIREQLELIAVQPSGMGPEQTTELMRKELARFGEVAAKGGIKVEN